MTYVHNIPYTPEEKAILWKRDFAVKFLAVFAVVSFFSQMYFFPTAAHGPNLKGILVCNLSCFGSIGGFFGITALVHRMMLKSATERLGASACIQGGSFDSEQGWSVIYSTNPE